MTMNNHTTKQQPSQDFDYRASHDVTLLETALYYASIGFSVHPLKEKGKTPLTTHGFQDATRDTATIKAWWTKWPSANIGIRCNGLLVVDADGDKGRQSLVDMESAYEKLPATWTVRTGRGGLHVIFRVSEDINIRPGAGKYGYESIDARANDSYIVAARSVTESRYETIHGTPEELAPAPDWLIKLIKESQPDYTQVRTSGSGKIPQGQNDSYLTSRAGGYRRQGDDYEAILRKLAIDVKDLEQNPVKPYTEADLQRIARSVTRYEPGNNGNGHKEAVPVGPGWVDLVNIQTEEVHWLWKPYIPIGKLTLLEGDPGIGKSWVALAIATAVSLGIALPFQNMMEYEGRVLLASAEDGLGDTIKPRLENMGANIGNIAAINGLMTFDEAGFNILDGYISEVMPVLLIIDPLVAYFSGDTDIHRANSVRHVTAQLHKLAEKWNMAVLAVRHLTKGGSVKNIYRGQGSIDFTASARSVLLAGCNPDDEQDRGMVHLKSNLAKSGEAIGYELREGGFFWKEHSELTADRILAGRDDNESEKERAIRFLKEYLSNGPATWDELTSEAAGSDISEATLRRARIDLKLSHTQQPEMGKRGGGKHYWGLPEKSELLNHR